LRFGGILRAVRVARTHALQDLERELRAVVGEVFAFLQGPKLELAILFDEIEPGP
jgi:hypothetical protein